MTVCGALLWFSLKDLPKLDMLKNYEPPQSSIVYDRRGTIIGRLSDERRTVISLNKLPRYVPLAFVAAEDGDFFEHRGIDYFGLLRAIILEIKFKTVGGRRVGGSTITQQTARALLLSSQQTYIRKLREIILAKRIEDALSKEQILSLYLNQIYFGNGAYGIEEASLTYFNKPAHKLLLAESAALASIPKSPNKINPFGDRERLKARKLYVLEQMLKHRFIDDEAAQKAKEEPLFGVEDKSQNVQKAPYFLSALKSDLSLELGDELIHKGGLKIYSTLDFAMQLKAQEALQDGLRAFDKRGAFRGPLFRFNHEEDKNIALKLEDFKKKILINKQNILWDLRNIKNIKLLNYKDNQISAGRVTRINNQNAVATVDLGSAIFEMPKEGWAWAKKSAATKLSDILHVGDIILVKVHKQAHYVSLEQEPELNGGLVALDAATGGVLAMVGGYDFTISPFNRITQSKRQPGSAIKPLLYAQALDKKVIEANRPIADVPKAFFDPGTNDFWRPRNYNNKFLGDITFRRCLRSSINICSIEILNLVGIKNFLSFAKELSLNTEDNPWPHNLTLALGSAESIPINIANAMRILANNGLFSPYKLLYSYKLANGQEKHKEIKAPQKIIAPGTAFIITHILKDVITTSQHEKYLYTVKSELAGKTGTTNDARSLWYVGYSPRIIALAFIGYDDNRSLGTDAWGITAAFPIWAQFMNTIAHPEDKLSFTVPDDIEWRTIEAETGRVFDESNEEDLGLSLIQEAFLKGTAPVIEKGEVQRPAVDNSNAVFAP